MKKLLAILGAIGLTATSSSAVVACGSSHSSSSSKLKTKLDYSNGNEVVLKLADGTVIRVKDFLKNANDDYILNEINNMVANKYAADYNQTAITDSSSTNLGLIDANRNYKIQGSDVNAYEQEIDNFNFVSISTNLYQQYVNSLLTTQPLDSTVYNSSSLNPIWYGNDFDNEGAYSVWFSADGKTFKRWTAKEEINTSKVTLQNNTDYLPSAEDLNKDHFYLIFDKSAPNGTSRKITSEDQIKADKLPGEIKEQDITGQQALMYRFQAYLQQNNSNSMINSLVMEYAKNNLYKLQSAPTKNAAAWETATNKSLYVDTSSTIAKDIQSWSMSNTDKITSSYKMVWRISVNSDDVDAINSVIYGKGSKLVNPVDPTLSSNDFAVFKPGTNIKDVFKAITDAATTTKTQDDGKSGNLSKKGADPFFDGSETGYQGIVKDGKVVDGGSLNLDSSLGDKISKTEGFGILQGAPKTDGTLTFDQKAAKGNDRDYVIVMPLYLMDILRDGPAAAGQDKNTNENAITNIAKNSWIELNPQVGNDWSSKDSFTSSDFKLWDGKDKDTLPKESSYYVSDGKTYIFIPENESKDSLTITDSTKGNAITVSPAKANDENTSGYGINGIFSNPKSDNADAQLLNGQNVNYSIHLGEGRNNPDSYEQMWLLSHSNQKVDDVAGLSNAKKTDLMNTLFALVAKDDSSLQEETKNSIYRNYISLDDIYYKALYDDLSKYLKEDDSTDESD